MVDKSNTILVFGAYGFIGANICRSLMQARLNVVGLGRNIDTAQSVLPHINWHIYDLAQLQKTNDWVPLLVGISHVVNCAGALQTTHSDDLDITHITAIAALSEACAVRGIGLIQISAVGADISANTEFLRTKGLGDQKVQREDLAYWIFRPGMVLAKNAYGGSALMRMLAAVPVIQPMALSNAQIQTVHINDISIAVLAAINGDIPSRICVDLVEDEPHSLQDLILNLRNWLGFKPAKWHLNLPLWMLYITAKLADGLALLGWRSPLRSTSISVLKEDVLGDPAPYRALSDHSITPLSSTLALMNTDSQDRLSARVSLLFPLSMLTLFLFWLISGVIGFWQVDRAALVLTDIGWSHNLAKFSVIFWSFIDCTLAFMLIVKRITTWALWGMIMTSLIYMVSAALITPDLWIDPLGPMVKILPAIMLALITRAMMGNR